MNITFHEIGAAVLSNAVLVLPLAVLAAALCRLVNRPAVAWCLWGLVLLKFVTPAWYPCVPTRWAQTPGVSPGGAALHGIDQSPLLNEQEELKHRMTSRDTDSSPGSRGWTSGNLRTDAARPYSTPENGDEARAALGDLAEDVAAGAVGEVARVEDDAHESQGGQSEVTETEATESVPPPLPVLADIPDDLPTTVAESIAGSVGSDEQVPPVEPRSLDRPASGLADVEVTERFVASDAGNRAMAQRSRLAEEGLGRNPEFGPIGGFTPPARRAVEIVVPVLIGIWAAGAIVFVTLAGMRVWRFSMLLRQAEAAPEELVKRARKLATKLGCRSAPLVRVTSGRVPPLLWGLGRRAVILLPRGILDELDDEQRSALLAHELAHFARRDHWTRWFELAVRSLYWWHPVAWWAGRRLREAEEQCCDAWVVCLLPDSARRYADALLKTVDYLAAAPRAVPTLATGITPVRRSLRPFHRRLTMIIEQRTNPRLSWPARLCLLALAGVVLPLSIVAVAEDKPAEDSQPAAITRASRSEEAPDNVEVDVRKERSKEAVHTRVFRLRHMDATDAISAFNFMYGNPEATPYKTSQPKFTADPGTNSITAVGTEADLKSIEYSLAKWDRASHAAESNDEQTEETITVVEAQTITVVRARYVLPEKVVEAFDKFIQQHGERFEFLVSKKTDASGRGGMGSMMGFSSGLGGLARGLRGADNSLPGMAAAAGLDPSMMGGMAASGVDPAMLSGLGGMAVLGGRGGPSMGRLRGATSQLTIIATPEVQQRFGDFINALVGARKDDAVPREDKDVDDAPETLTLARVHYKLPRTAQSGMEMMMGLDDDFGMGSMMGMAGAPQRSLGDGVFNLLTAVKESNLVPLLLVSADGDRLTVTTTEDFQEQLGKFIRFLQEHEPNDEALAERERIHGLLNDVVEEPRGAGRSARQKAAVLLRHARKRLATGDLKAAQGLALEAAKLNINYELFSDRPELVLADIEKAQAAASDESAAADSRTGRLMFGVRSPATSTRSRLSELRGRERELSALLDVIADSLQEEANRTPLLLAISQFYGNSGAGTSLIEMFNKLVELETQKGELVRSYGLQHPKVVEIQAKIDTQRRSFGLPTGADVQPVDLLDVYIQALKRQLDVTRKIASALEDEIPDAFRAPQPEKRSN